MPNNNQERLSYNPDELVGLTGLGRSTVYALLRAGKIPSLRLGRRILVPRQGLEEFLRSYKAGTGRNSMRILLSVDEDEHIRHCQLLCGSEEEEELLRRVLRNLISPDRWESLKRVLSK